MCFLEKSPCKFRDDVEEDIENEREKLYEERDMCYTCIYLKYPHIMFRLNMKKSI